MALLGRGRQSPPPVETLMADAAAGRFAADGFNAFKRLYLQRTLATIAEARRFAEEDEKELGEINPSPLFSLSARLSVETGKDAYCGGMANGNNTGIWLIGIGSAVDSLMAVREFVFERKEVALAELGQILADDWNGHEELRLRMQRAKRKWGNNDSDANALCREPAKAFAGEINGRPNSRGGRFKAHGHSARWHYFCGSGTGATPDGRRRGEELSKNISPTMGADTEGLTALIGSAANLDARDLPGDMPEKYENLQVRVCGWNVRWNDMPKTEQDKFILRAEGVGE